MEKYPKLIEQRFWKTQDDESAYLPHFGDFNLGGKKKIFVTTIVQVEKLW